MMDDFSKMSDDWIKNAVERNPILAMGDGTFRTCPVRGSFVYLLGKSKPSKDRPNGVYSTMLLFPKCADLSVLHAEAKLVEYARWPENDPTGPRYDPRKVTKVKSPFLDGAEILKYDGFHEGQTFIRVTTGSNGPGGRNGEKKIPVVDRKNMVITDPDLVYPGVWMIANINCYAYAGDTSKGVTWGVNMVMIVADDQRLDGAVTADPVRGFAGVNIDAGDVDTTGLFD